LIATRRSHDPAKYGLEIAPGKQQGAREVALAVETEVAANERNRPSNGCASVRGGFGSNMASIGKGEVSKSIYVLVLPAHSRYRPADQRVSKAAALTERAVVAHANICR
jgi:hypothetical protein